MSVNEDHRVITLGCGCWTICACGFHPEMTNDMTPLLGRKIVDDHVANKRNQ